MKIFIAPFLFTNIFMEIFFHIKMNGHQCVVCTTFCFFSSAFFRRSSSLLWHHSSHCCCCSAFLAIPAPPPPLHPLVVVRCCAPPTDMQSNGDIHFCIDKHCCCRRHCCRPPSTAIPRSFSLCSLHRVMPIFCSKILCDFL